LTVLSLYKYLKLAIIDFLYRHSGKGRAPSEAFSAIQVDSRSWFSGCRIRSGMTKISFDLMQKQTIALETKDSSSADHYLPNNNVGGRPPQNDKP
jgi:hypothetical protein